MSELETHLTRRRVTGLGRSSLRSLFGAKTRGVTIHGTYRSLFRRSCAHACFRNDGVFRDIRNLLARSLPSTRRTKSQYLPRLSASPAACGRRRFNRRNPCFQTGGHVNPVFGGIAVLCAEGASRRTGAVPLSHRHPPSVAPRRIPMAECLTLPAPAEGALIMTISLIAASIALAVLIVTNLADMWPGGS